MHHFKAILGGPLTPSSSFLQLYWVLGAGGDSASQQIKEREGKPTLRWSK
jgi:hypothetical protein